jgi:hypothetical protein
VSQPRTAPFGAAQPEERGMGFLDNAKDKLSDAVDKHGDKIEDGIDKAAAVADDKTGNKHTDKLEAGAGKAKDALDSLDGKDDDLK